MSDVYTHVKTLGEGTWGIVYEAVSKSGDRFAVKKIKGIDSMKTGMDFTALREVKYLQEMNHDNVVKLEAVYLEHNLLHMVMEFCPTDLEKLIQDKAKYLSPKLIASYLKMILRGLHHCHTSYVLHRDLKPSNILVSHNGTLKLADFGLARAFGSPVCMTAEVVTRWYRSPELLFGARYYGTGVDMWAVGCIFAEMIFRSPLFQAETDIGQLGKIFQITGVPTETTWPGVKSLPNYVDFQPSNFVDLTYLFRQQPPTTLPLFQRMILLNPSKRCSTKQALMDHYFVGNDTQATTTAESKS